MAREAFLINPPKRRKRKATSRKVTKAATRTRRKLKAHRPVLYETGPNLWSRSATSRSRAAGVKINPFGEEVMIVGANPRRKRRTSVKRRRRLSANAPKRARRRRTHKRNPMVAKSRRRRSYRRNPAAASVGSISLMNPMSLIMPAAIGIGAKMAAERLPAMVNMTAPLPKFGVQMAVAFGGGMLLSKAVGKQNAQIWTLFAAVEAISGLLQTYVFKGLAGFSSQFDYPQISAAPYVPQIASSGMSAYPEELGAFPYGESVVY